MKPRKTTPAPPVGSSALYGTWSPPDTAPRNGTLILGYFGYAGPQVAAWNTHDEKWATVSMMAQGMKNGTTDIWFETELESAKELKRWTPLPPLPNDDAAQNAGVLAHADEKTL